MINREECIKIGEKYNFKIISPEVDCKNYIEQASIFKECKYFICETGSGLFNFLLLPANCKILIISYRLRCIKTIENYAKYLMNYTGHKIKICNGELISGSSSNCKWELLTDKFEKSLQNLLSI